MTIQAKELDRLIPLKDGSHADVVGIGIDIPLRYTECFATLTNGRTVRLRNRGQFLGWSLGKKSTALYFRSGTRVIRLETDNKRHNSVRGIESWPDYSACRAHSASDPRVKSLGRGLHRIVAPDGHLLFVAPCREATRGIAIGTHQQPPAHAAAGVTL